MLLVHSGGLHYLLPPGALIPKLFRRIDVALESVAVDEFLEDCGSVAGIREELTRRRDRGLAYLAADTKTAAPPQGSAAPST